MSVFTTPVPSFNLRFGSSAFLIAPPSVSPLIRCAAQSAEISLQLMPQTFSVYVLKKVRNNRSPNSFTTQSSNDFGFRTGLKRACQQENTHHVDSSTPNWAIASNGLKGYA